MYENEGRTLHGQPEDKLKLSAALCEERPKPTLKIEQVERKHAALDSLAAFRTMLARSDPRDPRARRNSGCRVVLGTTSHYHGPAPCRKIQLEEVVMGKVVKSGLPVLFASLLLAATAHGSPPQCTPISDDTTCMARGSGGGGTAKSPTWCAYDCVGVETPVEIELPPGMVRCPGSPMGKVKFEQIKNFRPSTKVRTLRPPKK